MEKIDISGEWRVWLETADVAGDSSGTSDGKCPRQSECPATITPNGAEPTWTMIHLPGCTSEKGLGEPVSAKTKWIGSQFGTEFNSDPLYEPYRTAENYKFPYWLQPETRFVGKAFYERDVVLPGAESCAEPCFYKLFLERCHWKSIVQLDGEEIGSCDSLCTPHVYVFKAVPGRHKLNICIDNSLIYDVGPNAHSMSDQTQGNWNGIVGRMEITRISPVEFGKIAIYPDIIRKSFVVKADVINRSEKAVAVQFDTEISLSKGENGANDLMFVPIFEDNENPADRKPIPNAEKHVVVSVPPFQTVSVFRECKPVVGEHVNLASCVDAPVMHGDLAPQKLEAQSAESAQSKVAHGETEQSAQVTQSGQPTLSAKSDATGKVAGQDADFFDSLLWDEFNPSIINVNASLFSCDNSTKYDAGGSAESGDTKGGLDDLASKKLDEKCVRTGLRELSSEGRNLFINGRRLSLRGTLECCVFPKTGYPPCTPEEWHRIYRVVKDCGLNHVRFHSWCPPEAAFDAADEEGVYLQVECPLWKNQGSGFNGDAAFTNWLFAESERIIDMYGNHPSFILFNSGNEPDGCFVDFLGLWTSFWKQKDGRRLYNTSSGWAVNAENQYEVNSDPRLQQWGAEMTSAINALPPETCSDHSATLSLFSKPVVTHEMGQWCVFPDFDEMKLYTGYLKPRNFEVFADILKRRGLLHLARDFLEVSGKHQLLCYKEEIEKLLRTKDSAGFQLLGLSDFPGQGTALVGVLNAFWQEKGYCTKADFHAFCGSSVLLCRMEKRVFTDDETALFKLNLYRYEKARSDYKNTRPADETLTVQWFVTPVNTGAVPHIGDVPEAAASSGSGDVLCSGGVTAAGTTPAVLSGEFSFSVGSFGLFDVGEIRIPLKKLCAPGAFTLTTRLVQPDISPDSKDGVSEASGMSQSDSRATTNSRVRTNTRTAGDATICQNSWNFWVYPETVEFASFGVASPGDSTLVAASSGVYVSDTPDSDVFVCDTPDSAMFSCLEKGGKVLLLLPPENVATDVKTGFSSVFWNTSWTNGQGPHTLGVLCRSTHPIFKSFPTENWADWQWWYLMHGAASMVLDNLPASLEPLVQPVDTWFRSHKLALLFECTVGKGRLVVASSPLTLEMLASGGADIAPVRRQYLYSILEYMRSADFNPTQALSQNDILSLVAVNHGFC